jgi:hypothetical protein
MFLNFGKTEAEIMKLEKQLVREAITQSMRINFKIAQHWNDLSEWQIKPSGVLCLTRNEQTETKLLRK